MLAHAVTEEHTHKETIRLVWHYPEHAPRKSDPHYKDFQAVKRRLKSEGRLKCVVCGSDKNVELHHAHVEMALQNGVSIARLNEVLGLKLDSISFAAWIDSPGNLEPLCVQHHRGTEGVHFLPCPAWEAIRVWREDIPPPAEVAFSTAHDNSDAR